MYRKIKSVITLVLGITAFGLFQSVNADWFEDSKGGISAGEAQDIVISLKSNPMSNPEMACLAVTFARSLYGAGASTDFNVNVTLFVTLDGVSLADASVTDSRRFKCDIPGTFPENETVISLEDNLIAFLKDNNNNMVVCPLCWKSRYGDEAPDYGVLPGLSVNDDPDHGAPANAIGKMMLDAEKILDF